MSGPCCIDVGAKQTHTTQGNEEVIAGFNTYKTGQGKSVIVIFTDIFGSSFINIRKIADTFAHSTGATVLIPDFFNGDPMDPKASMSELRSQIPTWLEKHPVDQVVGFSDKFISTVKDQYQFIQVNVDDVFSFKSWFAFLRSLVSVMAPSR
jgi:dienelactone hydrolase